MYAGAMARVRRCGAAHTEYIGRGWVSVEWFLYRNVAEAGEDGCGIVDKWSGSVEEMEKFGGGCTWLCRGGWVDSYVIVYICTGDAGRYKDESNRRLLFFA